LLWLNELLPLACDILLLAMWQPPLVGIWVYAP